MFLIPVTGIVLCIYPVASACSMALTYKKRMQRVSREAAVKLALSREYVFPMTHVSRRDSSNGRTIRCQEHIEVGEVLLSVTGTYIL